MDLHHVSTGKKALVAGGVVLVGYLVYRHFSGTASAATLPTTKPLPAPGAGAAPGIQHLPEVASPYATASGGPGNYTVTTTSQPLAVRQGPGVSYPYVGKLSIGAVVPASGVTTTNPVDGYSWAEMLDATGTPYGWAAVNAEAGGGLSLTPVSSGANVAYQTSGMKLGIRAPRAASMPVSKMQSNIQWGAKGGTSPGTNVATEYLGDRPGVAWGPKGGTPTAAIPVMKPGWSMPTMGSSGGPLNAGISGWGRPGMASSHPVRITNVVPAPLVTPASFPSAMNAGVTSWGRPAGMNAGVTSWGRPGMAMQPMFDRAGGMTAR